VKDGLRVVDADGHTFEPADLYPRYIDPSFRDRLEGHVKMELAPGVLEALRFEEQL
jgi:hypothetical protein